MKFFLPVVIIVFLVVAYFAFRQSSDEIRYVPLGDSYTIGTGISESDNFPSQLTRDLNDQEMKVKLVANPAHNGWTSQELIDNELPIFERSGATFTTLLIGVNDFNRGVPMEIFRANLQTILNRLRKTKVILVTIPNFSVTPTGKIFGDPKYNTEGIQKFNEIIKAEAKNYNLPVVDIFSLSQQMVNDEMLIASDGLHPSAKEYQLWTQQILPAARELLKR